MVIMLISLTDFVNTIVELDIDSQLVRYILNTYAVLP